MEIYANTTQLVEINPKEVIKNLIEKEINRSSWVFEKNQKFYRGFEQSAGSHSFTTEEEITKEKYEYIRALQLVLSRLD